jgi:hypothetical protein
MILIWVPEDRHLQVVGCIDRSVDQQWRFKSTLETIAELDWVPEARIPGLGRFHSRHRILQNGPALGAQED